MCVDKIAVRSAAKSQCSGLSTSTVPHLNLRTNTPFRSAGGPCRYGKWRSDAGVDGLTGDVIMLECECVTELACPSSDGDVIIDSLRLACPSFPSVG